MKRHFFYRFPPLRVLIGLLLTAVMSSTPAEQPPLPDVGERIRAIEKAGMLRVAVLSNPRPSCHVRES